ncbi:ABC transporter substrate-binding protein [Paenibacillus hexagrammi]|uniref:ABC transporter substrate-binding protein n=1 Tax=Paenibacillus hexagrammi TaxID=2908839 RepID=UPI002882EB61|nr:extracellular solute-binding protein [Paenibacillus sp. YPD9-1]
MKKYLSVAAALTMSVSFLAACGSKADDQNGAAETPKATQGAAATAKSADSNADKIKGKITFLTNRTDMVGKEYVDYAKRFKEKYPNADVEFEAVQDHDKNIKVRMSTGDLPDVTLIPTIPNSDLPKYFAPLDDLGLNDKIYFKDYKATGGKVYGISAGATTVGIVYNKKAFADAGITDVPKTLDEFYAACEKLKAKGIVPLASNFKDQWPLYPWASEIPQVISGNPNLNNDRVKSDAPYAMDNAYGQSMSILRTMHEKGYLEPDINSTNWEQSKKDIASGKFAMYLLGNWVIPQVISSGTTSDNVGYFPFPYDNFGKLNAPLSPDWAYGVNKDSKNVETAKAFVKWMIEDSGFDDFAGFIPVLKDKQPKMAQLAEFNAYGAKYIEGASDSDDMTQIVNKAQIIKEAVVQDFVLNKDPKAYFDKLNEKMGCCKESFR